MTMIVTTSEIDLMRVGDECIFLTEQAYKPEYGVTVNKEYSAKVTEIHGSHQVWCDFVNDNGEKVTHARVTGFASGGERVTAKITFDVYRDRALEAQARYLAEIEKEYRERIEQAGAYYNRLIEKATPVSN